MQTTRRPPRWRLPALATAGLAALVLRGGIGGCHAPAESEVSPEIAALPAARDPSAAAVRTAAMRSQASRTAGPGAARASADRSAPPATLRLDPDLLLDLKDRVGPVTASRLEAAQDAGRAFARRLGIEGLEAQSIADLFTQLALDVAQAEQATAAGSDARASAVQQAAQNAIDGLRWLVPWAALPEAEREVERWTGGVPTTFSHPSQAEWENLQRRRQRGAQALSLP